MLAGKSSLPCHACADSLSYTIDKSDVYVNWSAHASVVKMHCGYKQESLGIHCFLVMFIYLVLPEVQTNK